MDRLIALLVIATVAAGVILPLLARAVRAARRGGAGVCEAVPPAGRPRSPSGAGPAIEAPTRRAALAEDESADFEAALAGNGLRPDGPAKRLGQLIADHPDAAAGVLRRWLAERE